VHQHAFKLLLERLSPGALACRYEYLDSKGLMEDVQPLLDAPEPPGSSGGGSAAAARLIPARYIIDASSVQNRFNNIKKIMGVRLSWLVWGGSLLHRCDVSRCVLVSQALKESFDKSGQSTCVDNTTGLLTDYGTKFVRGRGTVSPMQIEKNECNIRHWNVLAQCTSLRLLLGPSQGVDNAAASLKKKSKYVAAAEVAAAEVSWAVHAMQQGNATLYLFESKLRQGVGVSA
jgi:hypothetical protein